MKIKLYQPMTESIRLRNNISNWKSRQSALRRMYLDLDIKIQYAQHKLWSLAQNKKKTLAKDGETKHDKTK